MNGPDLQWNYNILLQGNFWFGGFTPEPPLASGPCRGGTPSALPRVEECTYFWGVNTSWGIDTAENKGPLHQEDNQAPQPTISHLEIDLNNSTDVVYDGL